MKFPRTELLDITAGHLFFVKTNWKKMVIQSYFLNFFFISNLNSFKYFLLKKKLFLNVLLRNMHKFTIKHSLLPKLLPIICVTKSNKIKQQYSSKLQPKTKKPLFKRIKKKFNNLLIIKNFFFNNTFFLMNLNFLNNLTDLNFLRKEKIYTKLKYSRVPQYDIVSGGAAALFAGFLGFLICEKFGFELLDSGDFYTLFMYCVFLFFFSRIFFKIMNATQNTQNVWNLQFFFFYVQTTVLCVMKFYYSLIFSCIRAIALKLHY